MLLAAVFLLSASLPRAQQPEPIRVNVDRVNVGVIVTDSRGKFVEGLRREDFHIFDNGVEEPLTDFAAVDEPAQVILLIEAGPAVYLLESGHLRAANALLQGLSPGDRIAIVKYAATPESVVDFTANKQVAAAALDNLQFNLGFGQLNLSSSLLALFERLTAASRKKTIVLLSTGVDTSGEQAWQSLLNRLKLGDVRVLAVSLSGELQSVPPAKRKKAAPESSALTAREFAEANQELQLIAEASGGRAYLPSNAKEFAAAYGQIAQLVRHEYSLAFAPAARDGKVHAIEVRVTNQATDPASPPAYRINHRRAYLAPAP